MPRSLEDKLNIYDDIIHDSDEEEVFRFTGPRSGKFLPFWHHVHEKSYDRKKRISEFAVREGEYEAEISEQARKIRELEKRIDKLMGRSRNTEIVCNLTNFESLELD